uniref:DNA-directed RNA polymerase subunit n=1 Tax=Pseudochlorodesmis sp. HV01306a TaxID=2358488 RepID=A0A386AXY2_9CHLO|nr:RNA polymerase b-subunit [Pseudochlorodesmis sp. HV01306a]
MKLPGLRLRLATSQTIRQWAQRKLPNGKIINGQILSPKTINYLTLKPEKDGLFCERLFGPVQDSICACGRQPQHGQKFCSRCEVEYISPRVRRYRLGYIELITAAAHVWFFKGRPSYFSLFLNIPPKKIEGLLYCTQNISRTIFPKELENLSLYSTNNPILPILLRNSPSQNTLFNSIFNVLTKKKRKKKNRRFYIFLNFSNVIFFKNLKKYNPKFYSLDSNPKSLLFTSSSIRFLNGLFYQSKNFISQPKNFISQLLVHSNGCFYEQPLKTMSKAMSKAKSKANLKAIRVINGIQQKSLKKENDFLKKSLWQKGGLRDAALFFGFSLISKRLCWPISPSWFSFVYFLIKTPKKEDVLNKFYSGPPGLVNLWGFQSRLFCFTGVQIIRTWLTQLTQNHCNDGRLLEIQIRLDLLQLERDETLSDNSFFEKIQLFRRFKYLRAFRHTQMNPASMVLRVLPVLPPDLRPILHLDNNQIAVSDFNKLYQTVLFRNRRLFRLTKDTNFHCLNSEALQYAQRLLQEAVDSLIENDNTAATSKSSRPLKSLSDLFKGKKGRFRQNLLGKRVDYSGRSVIVVGPYLKIYECGLPKEIAYELFQPFLLRILIFQKQAQTVLGAKKLLKKNPKLVLNLLKEVVPSHPILLNRAPTLHRLSLQAFQPRLVEGRAILLHPLVCSAFNADFDGDQMGVHLPLCFEARAEAWKINWSQNNLFSAATGLPICPPSQDIILGSSFLTTRNIQKLSFTILKNYLLSKSFNKYESSKVEIHKTQKELKTQIQFCHALLIKNKIKTVKNISDKPNFFFYKPYFFKNLDFNLSQDTTLSLAGGVSILLDINTITFTQSLHPFTYLQKQNLRFWNKNTQKGYKLLYKLLYKPFIKEVNYSNQSPIWYSYNPNINDFETEKKTQKLIEIRIHLNGNFKKFRAEIYQNFHSGGTEIIRKIRTTYSRLKFYNNLFLL